MAKLDWIRPVVYALVSPVLSYICIDTARAANSDPAPKKSRPQAQEPANPKLKTPRDKKPLNPEADQLLEENIFLSLVGPVQYETFGQSNQTGEQKYDPNVISYGLSFRWRKNSIFGSMGPEVLIRGFRSYENSSHLRPEGSTEESIESTKVSATDVAAGYVFSPEVTRNEIWFPYVGILFEYSQAVASRQLEASSFHEAEDTSITSKKIFSYIKASSAWTLTFSSLTLAMELNLTVPVRSWQLHINGTDTEEVFANRLQHKQAPGIGFSIGTAQWL